MTTTPDATAPTEPHDVQALLHHDHDRLHRVYEDLLDAAAADVDTVTLGEIWREFADGLEQHMCAEEELLFPCLDAGHHDAIEAFAKDHARMRELLTELDVAVDLHVVREPALQELVRVVRDHAEREDDTLYRWAQAELPDTGKRSVWTRLADWVSGDGPA